MRRQDLKPFWRRHLWLTKLTAFVMLLVSPLILIMYAVKRAPSVARDLYSGLFEIMAIQADS